MEQNIKYIPNNRFNVKLLNQSNPNHDGHDLCYNGILFKRHRINKNSINWLCKNSNCLGSITLKNSNDDIQHFVPHEFVWNHNNTFNEIDHTSNQYEVGMWNHFDTYSTPRTNNNLEGYN
jgi:hypothetical protein